MADIVQIRRDTVANWTNANPTLANGEQGYETDTKKMKVGDGSTSWTSLDYFAGGSSGAGGDACIVVAASDTPTKLKDRADYVCNGTDDHLTIESAFNDALTVLLCPSSTYYFGLEGTATPVNFNSLHMETNQRLIGAGSSTKITIPNLDNSYNYRFIDTVNGAHDIEIAHILIDGNNAVNTIGTQSGIELNGCVDVDVHHCIFQKCGDVTRGSCMGIADNTSNYPSYCWIHHNRFTDLADGINLSKPSNHILIAHNIIDDTNRDYGMNLGIADSVISNNIVRNCGLHGIHLDSYLSDGRGQRVIIHDNIVEDNNTRDTSQDGICIQGNCKDVLIHHNIIRKGTHQQYGISLIDDSSTYPDNIRIYDNDIYDSGVTGNLNISSNATNIEVEHNHGYNPVGGSAISVGASPFTYIAGTSPETIYIHAGTVSSVAVDSRTLFADTGHSIDLPSHVGVVVTYSGTPTMEKYVH